MLVLARGDATGLDGIPPAELSRRSLRKAVEELRRLGRDDLAAAVTTARLNRRRASGSRLPALGETRRYEAQHADGLDFVRTPTKPIGVRRGGDATAVVAHFVDAETTVYIGDDIAFRGPAIVLVPAPEEDGHA